MYRVRGDACLINFSDAPRCNEQILNHIDLWRHRFVWYRTVSDSTLTETLGVSLAGQYVRPYYVIMAWKEVSIMMHHWALVFRVNSMTEIYRNDGMPFYIRETCLIQVFGIQFREWLALGRPSEHLTRNINCQILKCNHVVDILITGISLV